MPRARRGWRAGQEVEPCPRRIHNFLEPVLLLLLHCDESHGYDLLEALKEFGFERNPVDSSTVYRILRSMEERGFVTSRWETGGTGPARRLYLMTEEGDRYLARWVDDLRATDRVLHHFLQTYDSHMKVHA
ncbi:MAG: helix-turn-helix transcriptional regulator [Anaerolineae bacterium]|jgi:PadR family transcriptional regulator, regulatory protein PadR